MEEIYGQKYAYFHIILLVYKTRYVVFSSHFEHLIKLYMYLAEICFHGNSQKPT